MATVNKVLAMADELWPNTYSEEAKAAWLTELDGKIAVEVLGIEPPVYGAEKWDDDLLVSAPYDNIYVLYVTAMVHFADRENESYNDARALFEGAMSEYRKWHNRTHMPAGKGGYQNVC